MPHHDESIDPAPAVTTPAPRFLPQVHWFRGLAMLLIVARHCEVLFRWDPATDLQLDAVFRDTSGFFFFLSGDLFTHLSRGESYGTYLTRKLNSVLIPYVIWSIPALVLYCSLIKRDNFGWVYDHSVPFQVAYFLLTGNHLAQFWFLPVLLLFYLASPLLQACSQPGRPFWIVLSAGLIATLLVNRGTPVLGSPELGNFLHFAGFLTLGMAFGRHHGTLEERLLPYRWVLLALLGGLTLWQFQRLEAGDPQKITTLQKLIAAPTLLVWLRSVPIPCPRYFSRIASLSFGIFCIHGYLIAAVRILIRMLFASGEFDPELLSQGSPLVPGHIGLLLLIFPLVLELSCSAVEFIQRLTGRWSRWIVGC